MFHWWKTFEQRRMEARLKMMYKISHNLVDFNSDMYLNPDPELRTRGSHALKIQIPMATKDVYKYSYFRRTVPGWNKLPSELVLSNSFEQFQTTFTSLLFLIVLYSILNYFNYFHGFCQEQEEI